MYKLAIRHFAKVDPILHKAAIAMKPLRQIKPLPPAKYFVKLCGEIIGQQLSGRVADVIYSRFENLFPGKKITPAKVLKLTEEKLRNTGMSWAKTKFIKDLALKTASHEVPWSKLHRLNDQEVINQLTKVHGIGAWTAEMFLIFTLGRPDVFSAGDQGLKNAIAKLPGLQSPSRWSPHRSWACRILWKTLDN